MTNQQPNGQTTSLTQNSRTRQITLIGLMTAITCISCTAVNSASIQSGTDFSHKSGLSLFPYLFWE